MTTKKGVFRKASTATTFTAAATADYVVVTADQAKEPAFDPAKVTTIAGSTACLIRDVQPSDFLDYDLSTDPLTWRALCPPKVG